MTVKCPGCDYANTHQTTETDRFFYGIDLAAVELSCLVLVWWCPQCELAWVDPDSEGARDEAVARYKQSLNQP